MEKYTVWNYNDVDILVDILVDFWVNSRALPARAL